VGHTSRDLAACSDAFGHGQAPAELHQIGNGVVEGFGKFDEFASAARRDRFGIAACKLACLERHLDDRSSETARE
jgi:hypothetical protein